MKKETLSIIEKIREKIFSQEYCKKYRVSEKDFTRVRIFNFARLILFQINIATRSLTIELTRFFQRIDYNIEEESFSKQSYSEARMKMKHEVYIELNRELVKEYYSTEDYKKYKGYRLLAIDGSRIALPKKEKLIEEFGLAENKGKTIPMAMSSTAYDVQNNIAISSLLDRYSASEIQLVETQLERIKEIRTSTTKDIIILDRGHRSLDLMVKMEDLGYDYIIRGTSNGFLKETNLAAKGNKSDSIIEINLRSKSSNKELQELVKQTGNETIKFRFLHILLKDGTIEYLMTSLLQKEFTPDDFKEIYHMRWNEEGYFNVQKNILEMENFSGRSPEAIRQDYFARILSANISSLIIEDAQNEMDQESNTGKYEHYKINKSVALGLLKDSVIEMIFSPPDIWEKQYRILVKAIKRYKIPVIQGRSFPRQPSLNGKSFLRRRKVL